MTGSVPSKREADQGEAADAIDWLVMRAWCLETEQS